LVHEVASTADGSCDDGDRKFVRGEGFVTFKTATGDGNPPSFPTPPTTLPLMLLTQLLALLLVLFTLPSWSECEGLRLL
jgi:hypothetical protein